MPLLYKIALFKSKLPSSFDFCCHSLLICLFYYFLSYTGLIYSFIVSSGNSPLSGGKPIQFSILVPLYPSNHSLFCPVTVDYILTPIVTSLYPCYPFKRQPQLKISRSVPMHSTCTRTEPQPSAIIVERCCSDWSDKGSSVTVREKKGYEV